MLHEFDKMMIKRFWREIIILVLVIAVAIAVNTCQGHKDNEGAAIESRDSSYLKIKTFETKNGELVSQVKTHEVTETQLKQNVDVLGINVKELKDQGVKLNNLVTYYKAKATVKEQITTTLHDTVYVDTAGVKHEGRTFGWKGKYLFLAGWVPKDSSKVTIDYSYVIKFSLTSYRKPKPLTDYLKFNFKPGQLLTNAKFEDQHVKLDNMTAIVTTEGKKKFVQTTGFKLLVGAAGGLVLRSQIKKLVQ